MAASCGTDGWHIPGTLVAAKWPHMALRHDRKYLCGQGVSCVELCICRTENPRVGGSILSLATTPIRVHSDQIGDVSYRNKLSPVNQEGHPALRPFAESHPEAMSIHGTGALVQRLHDPVNPTELKLG